MRATPAGTLVGNPQPTGATGTVKDGPQEALFNGIAVQWYKIDFTNGSDGWSGDDNFVEVAAPSPTPSPTPSVTPSPTPVPTPTYEDWMKKQNDWIRANPPVPDAKD